ncbi:MAG: hypothetical protein MMC23_000002 [Stictis urceolatum]|nr:hypothetical protein [Stictis urceolata]
MEEIEEIMFGNRKVPTKTSGHRKTRASRAIPDAKEWKSVDMESDQNNDTDTNLSDHPTASTPFETRDGTRIPSGLSIRPPQTESDVNFSVGGERGWAEKLEETDEAREKRLQGDRRAKEREMVRQAVRRVIVFGVAEEEQPNEKVEGQPRVKDKKKAAKEKDENSGEEERPAKRKAEAVMNGSIVDPSFAKGNWSVRWRERV